MAERFQIGWFVLEEDKVFRNTYDYAAWYEDVLVKAGKYPVYARHYSFNENTRKYGNDLKDFGNIIVNLPGVVVGDDFSPHFGGVAVKDTSNKHIGKESSYVYSPYAHAVASAILKGKSSIELIAPFKAVPVHFISCIDNKECTTYDIINTEL